MNMPAVSQKARFGFWIVIMLLGLALSISFFINIGVLIGWALVGSQSQGQQVRVDENPDLKEVWSYGSGEHKVVRIALSGIMIRETPDSLFGMRPDPVESILRQIRVAQNDPAVEGILLEVDSPGGAVTPVDEIYQALINFKASAENRVVVVFVRGLAASGGYYASMAADWIVAEPTALVGSISVIMQTLNWKELSDKIGVHDVTIKSGRNKDLLNPFREVNPEHLAMLQGVVDHFHLQFAEIVKKERSLAETAVKESCDGRIFSAKTALDFGLVDQIGYWSDANYKITELLKHDSVKMVRYEEHGGLWGMLTELRAPLPSLMLPGQFKLDSPRILYLWRP